jgi:hypothetical protein
MPNAFTLNALMLNAFMLNAFMSNTFMMNTIMTNVIILCAFMQNAMPLSIMTFRGHICDTQNK